MTRVLNGSLSDDLAESTLYLCTCWEVTLSDGQVKRFTDHDKDLTFLSNTYIADNSCQASMLESGENLSIDNVEMKIYLETHVSRDDIVGGLYDGARVKIYLVNWQNTANYCALPGGYLHRIEEDGTGEAVFELVSLSSKLNQKVGRIVIPTCDADVGDTRCGIDLTSYTHAGVVDSVTSRRVFVDTTTAQADDYFAYGKITWLTGDNAGYVSEVKTYSSNTFTIMKPPPNAIAVGDTFNATIGCDRTKETCINTFSNITNFRGFPFVPGSLRALSGPKL